MSNYTFQLDPGGKTRYNAGTYDQDAHTPRFRYEVLLPEHEKHRLDAKQFLMGPEGGRIWVWEFENRSTYPAFISIFKDGILV